MLLSAARLFARLRRSQSNPAIFFKSYQPFSILPASTGAPLLTRAMTFTPALNVRCARAARVLHSSCTTKGMSVQLLSSKRLRPCVPRFSRGTARNCSTVAAQGSKEETAVIGGEEQHAGPASETKPRSTVQVSESGQYIVSGTSVDGKEFNRVWNPKRKRFMDVQLLARLDSLPRAARKKIWRVKRKARRRYRMQLKRKINKKGKPRNKRRLLYLQLASRS